MPKARELTLQFAQQQPFTPRNEAPEGLPKECVIARDAQGNVTKSVPIFYFTKDLLYVGQLEHPVDRWNIDVTPELLDRYAATFNEMKAAGVKVPFVVDHSDDVDDGRGEVHKLWRDGDALFGLISVVGEDAAVQVARVPEVSVQINHVIDGTGKDYGDAIEHVSHSQYPIVPKQKPFVPIAASRGHAKRGIVLAASKKPNRSKVMALKTELKQKIEAKAVENGKTAEEVAAMSEEDLMAWFIEFTLGEGDGADAPDAQVIETLSRENSELKEQVQQLSRKGTQPEPNAEVLHERGIRITDRLNRLVTEHKLDSGTGQKLLSRLVGAKNKPNAMMLSRVEGDTDCLAAEIIDILAANNPPPKGEVTGSQTFELSRKIPGDNGDDPAKAQEDGHKRGTDWQQRQLSMRGMK